MALLKVRNLHKSFGKTEVLKDVSFTLDKGEVLSVIGSSGGGKTTLLRCVNFLELADRGIISVNGNVIFDAEKKLNESELRQNRLHFGMVFQSFNLFPQYTALRNITLPLDLRNPKEKAQNEEYAKQLLDKVGLSDKKDHYPCMLSGGQCQRVAIARALALKPEILCFDEPTSALDPELTGEVLKVIKELRSPERAMIIVTHEMQFAKDVSDKVIFMSEGAVEEYGTPEWIFERTSNEKVVKFLDKIHS